MCTEHCGRSVESTRQVEVHGDADETNHPVRGCGDARSVGARPGRVQRLEQRQGRRSRRGGAARADPGEPDREPPAALLSWAEEVNRLSGGTLRIEFENEWRRGEPDVRGRDARGRQGREGRHGLGRLSRLRHSRGDELPGARRAAAHRQLRPRGQGLRAGDPRADAGGRLRAGPRRDRRAPGPDAQAAGRVQAVRAARGLRRARSSGFRIPVSRTRPCARSAPRPELCPRGRSSTGSTPTSSSSRSIAGNSYDMSAKYVTANVNLWPRPLVIVMGKEAFESLTDEQQSALRDAAAAAIPEALAASRAEDEEAAPMLCRRGLTFAAASESDLAELRTALEPVYAELTSDPETKRVYRGHHRPQDRDRSLGGGTCLRLRPGRARVLGCVPGGHVRDDRDRGGLGRAGAPAATRSACSGWSSKTAS